VALVGAASFLFTIFTHTDGPTADCVFGYAFSPGLVALTVRSGATSTQMLRAR